MEEAGHTAHPAGAWDSPETQNRGSHQPQDSGHTAPLQVHRTFTEPCAHTARIWGGSPGSRASRASSSRHHKDRRHRGRCGGCGKPGRFQAAWEAVSPSPEESPMLARGFHSLPEAVSRSQSPTPTVSHNARYPPPKRHVLKPGRTLQVNVSRRGHW